MNIYPDKNNQCLVPSNHGQEYLERKWLNRQIWQIDEACKLITIGFLFDFRILNDNQERERREIEREFDRLNARGLGSDISPDEIILSQRNEAEKESRIQLQSMEIVFDDCKRLAQEGIESGTITTPFTRKNWLKWARKNGYSVDHLTAADPETIPQPEPEATTLQLPAEESLTDTGTTPEPTSPPAQPEATNPWAFLPVNEPYRARVIAICRGAIWTIANRSEYIKHGKGFSANKIAKEALDVSHKWWDEKRLEGAQYSNEVTARWVSKWLKAGKPNPD